MMNFMKLLSLFLTSCVILTASAFQDDTKAVSDRVVESPKLITRTMKKKLIRAAKAGKKKKSGVLKEAVSKSKSTKGPRMMRKSQASKMKVKEAGMIGKKKRGKSSKGPRYLEEYRTISRLRFKSSRTPKANHHRKGKSSKILKSSKKSTKIPKRKKPPIKQNLKRSSKVPKSSKSPSVNYHLVDE